MSAAADAVPSGGEDAGPVLDCCPALAEHILDRLELGERFLAIRLSGSQLRHGARRPPRSVGACHWKVCPRRSALYSARQVAKTVWSFSCSEMSQSTK